MAVQQQTEAVFAPGFGVRRGETSRRWLRAGVRFARRKPLGAFGGAVLVVLILAAILADVLAPYGATQQNTGPALEGPSLAHLLGVDQFGRDIFSRLLYGARISLYVGTGATILAVVPAAMLGIASAYFGGWFDYLMQRMVDAVQALPGLVLIIVVVVALGSGTLNIIIALALGSAITSSRVVRAATTQVMGSDYVEAARALGATDVRLMFRHVFPNVTAPIIVIASIGFGGFILAEASLSFLGLGVQPPAPSWGGMLARDGRNYMYAAAHMLWAPALALSVVIFGINMLGDALRDVLDPRLRGSGRN